MRLLFCDFTINFGGAPQGSLYLCRRLAVEHEVHVIDVYGRCREYAEAVHRAGLPLHILSPDSRETYIGGQRNPLRRYARMLVQMPDLLTIRRRFRRKVLEIDPDAIWVNNAKSLVLLVSCPALRRYPVVVYVREWARPEQVGAVLRRLMRHRVHGVLAHARASVEQLRLQGVPQSKLFYTPNTIDVSQVLHQARDCSEGTLPGENKPVRILLPAARLLKQKGVETAIRAAAHLRREGLDFALWILGNVATGQDASYPAALREMVRQWGVDEYVHFLGWRANVPALILQSTVVILPSYTEGFPRAILEAMLLRRPVCATPVGGIPEAIEHTETGLLFDVEDDAGLARCVLSLSRDHETVGRIVENAHNRFEREFRPENHTRAVVAMFEQLCRKNVNGRAG